MGDFDTSFLRDLYVTFRNLMTRFIKWIFGLNDDATDEG